MPEPHLPTDLPLLDATDEGIRRELHTARGSNGSLMGGCTGGKNHGEVLTLADDRDKFDTSVLGPTPNDYQYGYCADCRQGFRWSVSLQRWRLFPGDVVVLPMLTDEELDVLGSAVSYSMEHYGGIEALAQSHGVTTEVRYLLGILNSLQTAITEARYSLG